MADRPPHRESPPGYLQVLRECPDFRLLFSARVVSLLGDWFSTLATIALLRDVTGSSPGAIAGMLILKLLPIFLAGPVAGVVADRYSRRGIMLLSDLVRVMFVLLLLLAPATSHPVGYAYVLITCQVVASAFFEPARAAAVPQLVPDRYLAAANGVGAVAWSVMFTLGAALGGVVTDVFGWRTALTIDAGTYAISALLLLRLRLPARERKTDGRTDWLTLSGLRELGEGLSFIAKRPGVATALLVKTGWGVAGAITLFLTLFGEREYAFRDRPDLGVALLYVARALGTGIGPLLARRLAPRETPAAMRCLIFGSFLWPACWYLVFATTGHWLVAATAVTLAHFGGSVLWVYSTLLLQRSVPDAFRGRVMSTDLGLATLAISISLGVYGALAEAPGADLRTLVRWMSISLLLPAVAWWWAAGRFPVGRAPATSPQVGHPR